jgi:hypothetical protein
MSLPALCLGSILDRILDQQSRPFDVVWRLEFVNF